MKRLHRMTGLITFCAALLATLLTAVSATAAAPGEVFLEDLTTAEVAMAIRDGTTTIIIPVGGTEQSGPHLTLGKHNLRVRVLAGRIAAQLGHTLVAPVVAHAHQCTRSSDPGSIRFGRFPDVDCQLAFARRLEVVHLVDQALVDGVADRQHHQPAG